MNIALWIVQVALAAVFVMSGGFKVVQPIETLGAEMAWVADVSPALIRFIGTCEILGAVGIILPALTRILPWLTPLAAAGLGTVMLLAGIFHLTRGEFMSLIPNLVLLVLALFVVYGRLKLHPIAAK